MWKTVLLGLIFVSPPFLKKWLLVWFCGAQIGHNAQIGWFSAVTGKHVVIGDHSAIRPLTLIHVSGDVRIGNHSEISSFTLVYGSASFEVGNWSYIGPQSLINVDEDVVIGNESALGPRCMVFTHASFFPYNEGYWVKRAGVHLGDRVWCAAGVFIHPGIEIGDHSFVNSRSVVTQSIPSGSVVEGNPGKVVYPLERTIRKPTPRYVDQAMRKVLHDFTEVGLGRELGISRDAISEEKDQLSLVWKGTSYRILLIPSDGEFASLDPKKSGEKQVILQNRADWKPSEKMMCFDLTSMRTKYCSDPIHTELRLFMLRYYGIRFTDLI